MGGTVASAFRKPRLSPSARPALPSAHRLEAMKPKASRASLVWFQELHDDCKKKIGKMIETVEKEFRKATAFDCTSRREEDGLEENRRLPASSSRDPMDDHITD
jgi:hypothetical protein